MKYLKMLGLAAIAAVAAMAIVGAGTASADEVCTDKPVNNMCPEGKLITTIEASQVGTGSLETTGGTTLVTCAAGDIHISVTNQGTGVDPITGNIEELEFTECSNTVDTLSTGTLNATHTGEGTSGKLTALGSEVTVAGIFGASCVYGASGALEIGTTSGTTLTVNAIVPRLSGGFSCPADTRWTAEFEITNHTEVDFINN